MSATAERRGFAALFAAAQAAEQQRPEQFVAALESTTTKELVRTAARHRCLGYLYRAILEQRVRTTAARAYLDATRDYRAKAALQAFATRSQLREVVATLDAAAIPFILLKGAARLLRRDPEAEWNLMGDLDILVPPESAFAAMATLMEKGYRPYTEGNESEHYDQHHHHLLPLLSPTPGLYIELHRELAVPGTLSLATDWNACAPLAERVSDDGTSALCLNGLGTAFHLLVHGLGFRRLHDTVMLARRLREQADIMGPLQALVAQERLRPVSLQAGVALAARIAGIALPESEPVTRCIAWLWRREMLNTYLRERTQFVDAWYANGGRLFGPATREALPNFYAPRQNTVTRAVVFGYRVAGRALTSAWGALTAPRPRVAGLPST